MFLHRVVVSSFFSSSSNNSTRSLDVIVVGRSKKPRKRVERLSPPTFTNVMIHRLCAFFWAKQQTNLSRQKTKKNTSFFHHFVPSFSFPFPPFAQFRLKTEGKSKNIFVLETGKKKECRQNQARANKTHARRKKKELARIKSTRTRASKGTR